MSAAGLSRSLQGREPTCLWTSASAATDPGVQIDVYPNGAAVVVEDAAALEGRFAFVIGSPHVVRNQRPGTQQPVDDKMLGRFAFPQVRRCHAAHSAGERADDHLYECDRNCGVEGVSASFQDLCAFVGGPGVDADYYAAHLLMVSFAAGVIQYLV